VSERVEGAWRNAALFFSNVAICYNAEYLKLNIKNQRGITMDILVIGGTQGIGLLVVEQALEKGHMVTVMARNPSGLRLHHQNLKVMKGDILDPVSVRDAVSGQDVVVSSVGALPTMKPVKLFSEGTKNVLHAMKKEGVRFLIAVTGIGAGDSKGYWGFMYSMIFTLLLLKTIYKDKDQQESLIKKSEVDWIIIRPGFLTDGPLTGKYRVLTDMKIIRPATISRADVAHFILEQIISRSYLNQAPLLMY
jgi:putative NADH-flavin reductase